MSGVTVFLSTGILLYLCLSLKTLLKGFIIKLDFSADMIFVGEKSHVKAIDLMPQGDGEGGEEEEEDDDMRTRLWLAFDGALA